MKASHYFLTATTLLSLSSAASYAQTDTAAMNSFHAAVTSFIDTAAVEPLVSGDTLVSWGQKGPILFHTILNKPDTTVSSMLRADRMTGTLLTIRSGWRPKGFDARWNERGRPTVVRKGVVIGANISITGTKDTVLAVPAGLWAIADYAMDDHLVAVFRQAASDTLSKQLVIFRPYPMKWDTVTIAARQTRGFLIVSQRYRSGDESQFAVDENGRMIWYSNPKQKSERRPVEGSMLYPVYVRFQQQFLRE